MLYLNAEIRQNQGKIFNKNLRTKNICPGIVYGKNIQSLPIQIYQKIILPIQNDKIFYKHTITLVINDRKTNVKVKALQWHPYKNILIHIDFIYV